MSLCPMIRFCAFHCVMPWRTNQKRFVLLARMHPLYVSLALMNYAHWDAHKDPRPSTQPPASLQVRLPRSVIEFHRDGATIPIIKALTSHNRMYIKPVLGNLTKYERIWRFMRALLVSSTRMLWVHD